MKTFIISMLVFTAWATSLPAQITREQADDNIIVNTNSSWTTLRYGFGDEGVICNVETEYVYFDGDSIVDGKSFKQVYAYYDEAHQYAHYKGLMREENQKTYFIPFGKQREYLIYDFSLEEGMSFEYEDYFEFLGFQKPPLSLYVNAVDYVEINGTMKKRIQLVLDEAHNQVVDTWIEGIGSMNGVLDPCYNYFLFGIFRDLLCYFQDQELIYENSEYDRCYYGNIEDLFTLTITPNKVWHIEYGYPCPEGDEVGCYCFAGIQTIKIGNSKLFKGIEYYELLSNKQEQQWELITYVREKDRRVYFYVESCDKEYEMYDFNRQPGFHVSYIDPLHPFSLFNFENPCELTEEDLNLHEYFFTEERVIEYNGVKRKWLRLGHQWPSDQYDTWVEGIGSMRGITYQVTQQLSEVHQLKDCYEADELIFVNENPEYCWSTVSIKNPQKDLMNIFNDSHNMLHIINAKNIPLIIYDIQGRKVKSILPHDDHVIMDLSYLPKGLYIVVSQIRNLTFKIIVK